MFVSDRSGFASCQQFGLVTLFLETGGMELKQLLAAVDTHQVLEYPGARLVDNAAGSRRSGRSTTIYASTLVLSDFNFLYSN